MMTNKLSSYHQMFNILGQLSGFTNKRSILSFVNFNTYQ